MGGAKNSEDSDVPASESEQTPSSCLIAEPPCEMVMSSAPRRNPLHLLKRMFQAQDDDPVPAMTTSDSLSSRSSDCSISTRSTQDFLSSQPTKRLTKMSPHPNAEWAIIEKTFLLKRKISSLICPQSWYMWSDESA